MPKKTGRATVEQIVNEIETLVYAINCEEMQSGDPFNLANCIKEVATLLNVLSIKDLLRQQSKHLQTAADGCQVKALQRFMRKKILTK